MSQQYPANARRILGSILLLLASAVALADSATQAQRTRVTLTGDPLTRGSYELRLIVPANGHRSFDHVERISGTTRFSADGTAEVDLAEVVRRIPGWDPELDTIRIEGDPVRPDGGAGEVANGPSGADPLFMQVNPTSTPGGTYLTYHVKRDVAGPDFNGLGNNADDFEVEHHAFVVENTRSTIDDADGTSLNTGGIAVVLHNDGNDDLSVLDLGSYDVADHVLNTVNRNDHFLTFFREDADGVRDIVGRVEGLSFWDMGEINQQLIDFFADSGHLPWNWFDLDVTFNDPADWLQVEFPTLSHSGTAPTFSGGALPWLRFNNLSCERNQSTEVCIDMGTLGPEIDLTFEPGSRPSIGWGYLDDPFMGLSLSGGSISGTPPIEFGSPFLKVDESAANQFAADLEDFFGDVAPVAFEMKTNPVGFAAKYLFALRGGVTYESGSGDYAEWLERMDPDEAIEAGEIVGVHGGKITRRTAGADHAMVVSYKPIVLGNMPSSDRQERFEKVAFMGQTLVKVVGRVEKGDYILPSGKNDGNGVAVAPDAIRADQLASVVGIAWGTGGVAGRIGLVNVAVGLRPVEITRVIGEQQASLEQLRDAQTDAQREIARLRGELETMSVAVGQLTELRAQVEALLAVRVADGGK